MMHLSGKILLIGAISMAGLHVQAQDADSLLRLQPDDILLLQSERLGTEAVSIASRKIQNSREAPGIVSLIERDEIIRSGARDLIDILHLIPGFSIGKDVQGITGMGLRGNWGHEGKILLQLNGLPLNEILYGTSYMGNRFPVELIERIEIIRGPGSAMYGGFAELGVVNIITRNGKSLNGASVATTYGQMDADFGRSNTSVAFGKETDDFSIDAIGYLGIANRSTAEFADFYGNTFGMKGENARILPGLFQLRANYKRFSATFFNEDYRLNNRSAFYINSPEITHYHYKTSAFDLTHNLPLGEKAGLQSQVTWLHQMPYNSVEESAYQATVDNPEAYSGIYYGTSARRAMASAIFSYEPSKAVSLYAGAKIMGDKADGSGSIGTLYGSGKTVTYQNQAFFAQGLFQTKPVNITIGARYENHSAFGAAFAPRIALTKMWKHLHMKMLYSRAFRSPSIENIQLAEGIVPERTGVFEVEAGYQFSKGFSITANLFDIHIEDPIIYFYSEDGEGYENQGGVGTRGIEVESKYMGERYSLRINYSYYQVSENDVPLYAIPANGVFLETGFGEDELLNSRQLLGMPAHKIAGYASWHISKQLSLTPSAIFMGKRYGFHAVDENDVSLAKAFPSTFLLNMHLYCKRLAIEGLSLSVGVNDLLNQRYVFIQPYNGYHAPMPGPSREWLLRLMYAF